MVEINEISTVEINELSTVEINEILKHAHHYHTTVGISLFNYLSILPDSNKQISTEAVCMYN